MSDEFDIYELKQMIEEQKERIDALIRLQSLQGLSLAEIEYFTLSFSGERSAKFLSKIQSLLQCSPVALEKIAKELPQYIELKWETYQKGRGYHDFSSLNEKDQLDDGYEFVRETVKKSYTDGRVCEFTQDDRNDRDYLLNISLNECLTTEELKRVSNNEEEYIHLRVGFCEGKFFIVIDGNEGRELFQMYSVGIFDAIEMKKYVYLESQVFSDYFERTYCVHEDQLGFFLRRHIKDFIAKRTLNISKISPGMNWHEAKKLLGDPILKYPNRGDFSIEFYWVDIPWPNESNDDYMVPLIMQKKPKEKVNEFDLDFEFVISGYGWDYLDTILKK